MMDISAILAFLQSTGFVAFITSYSVTKGLDFLIDAAKNKITELSPEEQLVDVISLSLHDTCIKFKNKADFDTIFTTYTMSLKNDISEINDVKLKSILFGAINTDANFQADDIFEYWTKRFDYYLTQPKYQWLFNYINQQYHRSLNLEIKKGERLETKKYQNYTKQLHDLIFKKVPFDSFSINDIYVPLLGYYKTWSEYNYEFFPNSFFDYNIISLEEWILNWIENHDDQNILLLSGKPASGKTTLMKQLAHHLIVGNYYTVLIPLKRFSFDSNINESVKQFCIENTGINPFQSELNHRGIVLLFDGLDEISLRGVDSMKKATEFIENIIKSYQGKEIRIIISGRSLSISSVSRLFKKHEREYILHLLPLYTDPDYVDRHWSVTSGQLIDLRPRWWEKYGKIRNVDYTELSNIIMNDLQCDVETYNEITGEPFLLYLLAFSYENKVFDYTQHVSVTDLYEFFVEKVYKNVWKDSVSTATIISKTAFIDFLQEVAICSWHSGEQVIPLEAVEARCNTTYFRQIIKEMTNTENYSEGIVNLLVLFYVDEKDGIEGERSFEFTHKSFCDFFVGKKIATSICTLLSNPYTKETYDKLMDIIGKQYFDLYIDNFLRDEFSKIYKTEKALVDSMCERMSQLFPKFILHDSNYCTVIEQNGQSYLNENSIIFEKNFFRILCILAKIRKRNIVIPFENTYHFKDWINSAMSWSGDNVDDPADFNTNVMKLISRVDFIRKNELVFSGIQLQNFEISHCNFNNVKLEYASMRWAIIDNIEFSETDCGGADFTYSQLNKIKYLGGKTTKLSDTNFTNASIAESQFLGADFSRANFTNTTIQDTSFEHCSFHKSIFNSSELNRVRFRNCKFDCLITDSTIELSKFIGNCIGIQLHSTSVHSCKINLNGKEKKLKNITKDTTKNAVIDLERLIYQQE